MQSCYDLEEDVPPLLDKVGARVNNGREQDKCPRDICQGVSWAFICAIR